MVRPQPNTCGKLTHASGRQCAESRTPPHPPPVIMAGQHHLPPVQLAPNGSLLNEARFEVAQLIINHTYEEAIDIIAKFSAFKKAQLQKQVQVEQERRKTLEEEKLAFREKANASIREKEEIERQIKLLRLRVSLGLVPGRCP